MNAKINHGKIAMSWWSSMLAADTGAASALRANIRRANQPSEVLSERAVFDLALRLELRNPLQIYRLVKVLARIKEHDGRPLLRILGGKDPKLSQKRFNRLLTMEFGDIENGVGNAIDLAAGHCNVAQIARDVLFWSETVRCRWCFDYHNSEAPAVLQSKSEEEQTV
ncbi:hypothetical protein LCGC14_0227760 [marine sediment metagenome]|uniref:Uncharacterized protein n=1 Tax=marine sediment metagenome TaxID=412755 RepID=A0A0F9USF7_9ZZZZ